MWSFTGCLCGSVGVVEHADIWGEEAARRYDTPGVGMFAPEVLGPTVERLRALAGGGRTLEMAIGTGRVAVPLAEAGVAVAGIELCQPMVDQLRTKVGEELIPVVLGDMTTARVDGRFSLVFLVFNGISNVLTQERQIAVFENAAHHLVPGGRFVIELWVPDLRHLPPGRTGSVFAAKRGYLAADIFDVVAQHVVSHHVRFDPEGGTSARIFRSPHRYVWPAELDVMARIAGFSLESRHGGWSEEPFTAESSDHVSVYRLG
ncbi:MAG: class I SAM-dependent methyltransferase [Actinobacteria bacterium]|nr:class I SAM-dependent methyltransferase [Actinomycetota bacterium]